MTNRQIVAFILAVAVQANAQQQGKPLTFDVASVKVATVPDGVTVKGEMLGVRKGSGVAISPNSGGPGTSDPGRIHYPLISLKALLVRAYGSYFEIVGPDWLDTQIVQVDATMPPDTTKEQFQEMLRNLITERFQLKHHTETRQVTGYSLTVTKGGSKMKVAAFTGQPEIDDGSWKTAPRKKDSEGFVNAPPRPGPWCMEQTNLGDRSRMICQQQSMQDLANGLGRILHSTVTDATGLTAKYDFTVTYAGGMEPGGGIASPSTASTADGVEPLPDIFSALQSQLGLKLDPKKAPVEVFVVDHMEKTPTGN